MAISKDFRPPPQKQAGTTAVEFAIIVSLLLVLLLGILEFGFIFMQKHYVSNAAREGARIGIKANNFECFEGGCSAATDRKIQIENKVKEYLGSVYNPADTTVTIQRDPNQDSKPPSGAKTLIVTVEAPNFFPPILSALVPGLTNPGTISFTTRMDYEDPAEP